MRLLQMKDALLSTVHLAALKELEKTNVIPTAIFDITDTKFFKALYILLITLFLAIRVLVTATKVSPAWISCIISPIVPPMHSTGQRIN